MLASRTILIMVKLVKITTGYGKMLIICENLGKGQPRGMLCQKREMDGCVPWMKSDGLYTSGVVGREPIHMGYVKQELFSM